jgi:hypothetical protein
MHKSIVIPITFHGERYLRSNGIMGRLNECSGIKHLLIELDHPVKKYTGVFEASIGTAGYNCIRHFKTGIFETERGSCNTHFDDTTHAADHLRVNPCFIIRFDTGKPGGMISDDFRRQFICSERMLG